VNSILENAGEMYMSPNTQKTKLSFTFVRRELYPTPRGIETEEKHTAVSRADLESPEIEYVDSQPTSSADAQARRMTLIGYN